VQERRGHPDRTCARRCNRSLKKDEEITLWRSLCALGAPLYGNLCISFSPFLSSLFLSSSLFFSLSASRLSFSASRSRLFLPSSSFPLRSPTSPRVHLSLLARSVKHKRHGISPIPSFSPQVFLSSPLCSFLFFFPLIPPSLSLSLAHSFLSCSYTSVRTSFLF